MNSVQTFPEQLRAWRDYYRLTPAQLCEYTGIPEKTLTALESGSVRPDARTAAILNYFFVENYQEGNSGSRIRPVLSYPTPAQSSPAQTSYPVPSRPAPTLSYGQFSVPAQPAVYSVPAQSYPAGQAYMQNTAYITHAEKIPAGTGIALFYAILQVILFCLPFVFLFFPFLLINVPDFIGGFEVGFKTIETAGGSLFVFESYGFSFAALVVQIGLWITVLAGLVMVVLSLLRIFGIDGNLFAARTSLFYIYTVGAVFCLIGTIAAGSGLCWGLVVYTVLVFAAAICRIFTDGGQKSFAFVR